MEDIDIQKLVDKVVREEYGGSHPGVENPCKLKARVRNQSIEVFIGSWRGVRHYNAPGRIPSVRVMREVETTVRINTGSRWNSETGKLEGGTFDKIKIEWVWCP